MDAVKSSAIKSTERDSSGIVRVQFHSGGTHSFGPFTEAQYQAFVNAPSAGKHFHKYVAPKAVK